MEGKPNDKAVSYCRQKLLSGVLPTNAIKSEFTIIYPPKGKKTTIKYFTTKPNT